MSVCVTVILVLPAKAVGGNEMPFGRDTCEVPSNIVLDRGPGPPWQGEIWWSEPPVHSNATYHQITLALVSFAVYYYFLLLTQIQIHLVCCV